MFGGYESGQSICPIYDFFRIAKGDVAIKIYRNIPEKGTDQNAV